MAAIAHITVAGDTTERDVATLASKGEAVPNLLTHSADRLEFQTEIGDALGHVAQDLARLAADASPCRDDTQTTLAALFAQLSAFYIMAQEREIQPAVAATWPVDIATGASVIVEARSDALEDALF